MYLARANGFLAEVQKNEDVISLSSLEYLQDLKFLLLQMI